MGIEHLTYDDNEYGRRRLLADLLKMKVNRDKIDKTLQEYGYSPLYVKRPEDAIWIYVIKERCSVMRWFEMMRSWKLPSQDTIRYLVIR